jgi:hypothetical protein
MTEQLNQGRLVQRIVFLRGVVLELDDYNELLISAPMRLTLPPVGPYPAEVVPIDPMAVTNAQAPLFDFAGATCTQVDWGEDGTLHLELSDGHLIDVPGDDHITAWELYDRDHGYAACLPHGKVRIVRHDLPEDDDNTQERPTKVPFNTYVLSATQKRVEWFKNRGGYAVTDDVVELALSEFLDRAGVPKVNGNGDLAA